MENKDGGPEPRPTTPVVSWASIREISGLIKTQWPRYLVDILVIILGITISFTLDSRKEEADRATLEQVYLKSLLTDVNSDLDELTRNVIPATSEILTKSEQLLRLSDAPGAPDPNQFSTNIKIITGRPNFISKDATFSDLRSSGNMQLITDVKLKTGLFEYARLYEAIKGVQFSERETSNTIIGPYLIKRLSIKSMVLGNSSILPPGIQLKDVLQENEFSNVAALRLITRKELLEDYQEAAKLGGRIQAKLTSMIK
jgi:hypothetical protein